MMESREIPTPHIASVALFATAAYVLYRIIQRIDLARRRAAFARQHGCLPAPKYKQSDTMFGMTEFKKMMAAVKSHTLLDRHVQRFKDTGTTTFEIVSFGRRINATMEPEILKTMQATNSKQWGVGGRRKISFRPFLGVGIFTTDGSQWAHSREMLRPNFVRSQVADLDTFETHVKDLIATVPADGATVNLSDLFFRLTIDSATEFLFGESTNTLSSDSLDGFAGAFNRCQEYVGNSARMGIFGDFRPHSKQFKADRKYVYDMVDYYVQRGLDKKAQGDVKSSGEKAQSGRYVFIDELVRQTSDQVRIRSELLNILLAGRDTTASLLTNVWSTISKRPDIWNKLQAEVAQLDGRKPTFEELKDMKYIRAVLNESLRLYPVVPSNSRQAKEDTILPLGGGLDGRAPLFIKKGTVMMWSVYAMHRRKDYYGEDAEEFRPERWIDNPETGVKGLRPGWEYLPFNGGARICLGQQFALTEASYTTIRLCQAFSGIESRDSSPWTEGLTLTCVNLHGAKVGLTPREE